MGEVTRLQVERVREKKRHEAEDAKREAELQSLRKFQADVAGNSSDRPGSSAGISRVQQQLLSEVESLRKGVASVGGPSGPGHGDLVERNRQLQARLDLLQERTPAEQRLQ